MADQNFGVSEFVTLLDNFAAKAMDNFTRAALARARRALYQQAPRGRTPINDDVAIRKISELVTASGCSFHSAAMKVARELRPFAPNHKAIAERFRRKAKRYST